ncbi:zinc transporter ZntB (plasmid) [Vibrio nigripulchritudo]|uniref:zinc transporter ZntB n=1 Tax=Vibrio nigripulchritudo TaxID=28173 RepID=UPI00190CA663|nr:zinc transporter ZntB [Vibrio nigripulchritudo]BCL73667.1 zinc transporter ZntB [Vibrio nigripulchritudo]
MEESHVISSWSLTDEGPRKVHIDRINLSSPCWVHCQRDHPELKAWLESQAIPEPLIESLLMDDTRPRFEQYDDGTVLIILRGINLNAGAEPDDMLSLRLLWFKGSLISTRKIPSKTVSMVIQQLEQARGPDTISELLVALIQGVNSYITNYLAPIEEQLNSMDNVDSSNLSELSQIKSRLLRIRRYLKPQKYVLEDLLSAELKELEHLQFTIKNSHDTVLRINESIDFFIEHIDLSFNAFHQEQAEKMNKNSYFLSIVAGIFLPAGFFTGLLGVNIAGMPGTDNPYAFLIFCVSLLAIVLLEVILLKKLKFT